jgi:hypothetical protein
MKRSLYLALILALTLAIFLPGAVSASNITTYTSGFQVQNLNASAVANITITFYNRSDGSQAGTQSATIPAGGSSTFFPLNAVPSGFDGSAVISSDQPVAAIVNLLGNSTQHAAAYGGLSSGATTVNIPLVQKNNYGINSFVNVQNAGSASASVTITYPGTACTENATILPGAAHRFDQSTNSCLSDGPHAAQVTSSQPVVAAVIQTQSDNQYLNAAMLAYDGFASSGSTSPVMPLISSGWYGSVTGIQIMNTGGSNTNVTVTYTPSAGFPGATCTETKQILAGQSTTFGLSTGNLLPAACRTLQSGYTAFVGSARVTANSASQNLVAIVNQINSTNAQAAAYGAFDPATGTTSVSLPLIADRNYGIFSGIAVMNVGGSSTTINCTFTGTSHTESATVAAGASLTAVQLNAIAASYVGSATCTASQPIVAVVNYLDPGTITHALDGLSVYEGINY